WGRAVVDAGDPHAALRWYADPGSPDGRPQPPPPQPQAVPTVLDAVYGPLRLDGTSPWRARDRDAVFVLHSPNKALGLCGVRGAYAIAPARADYDLAGWLQALRAAEPSWVLSAQAVALLSAWCEPSVQRWLAASLARLARWKAQLAAALARRGAQIKPSETNFFSLRLPGAPSVASLRRHGIAVRELSSFGLPGAWRVSAQPPAAQRALLAALDAYRC
ncbi:MAG: aminotransferase class I/II-fold pyridoxal phosphate-dependent enzyme, partial [Burkholderiaceae bacterium]|nr:aminotransferase class I/II-fold pyridoxal phosphate-dependent enzyme [Burkholderiaceae bacterium]